MKTNLYTNKKVEATLNAANEIKKVAASPFFKEKVMQQIRSTSNNGDVNNWSWLVPKLQLGTLALFVILNMYTVIITSAKNPAAIDEFALSSGLIDDDDITTFN